MFGAVIAPAKLPALRQLADDYQPDLIVHAEVDVAAPLLAAERGLPSVTYGFAQPLDPNMLAALAERVAPLWRSAGLNPDAVTLTAVRDAVMAIVEPENPEQSMARRIAAEIAAMPAATEVVQRLRVRRNRLTDPSAGYHTKCVGGITQSSF